MTTPEDIKGWLAASMPCDSVQIDGDGQHFQAVIVSPVFVGLSRVARHQRVYQALGEHMVSDIHALSMQTLTPEEWASHHG